MKGRADTLEQRTLQWHPLSTSSKRPFQNNRAWRRMSRRPGRCAESAFVEPPWLLEREGEGYIQVPRPLYRIAERADGQRTLQDLAQDVSQTEGRGVSADNVRHLVATRSFRRESLRPATGLSRILRPHAPRSQSRG